MKNPLLLFGFFAAAVGGGLGVYKSFIDGAERDILRHLEAVPDGGPPQVKIQLLGSNIFQAATGVIQGISVSASNFRCQGLPFYTQASTRRTGRLNHLRIQLRDFSLKSLFVQSLTADVPNCRFQWGLAVKSHQVHFTHTGEGPATAIVSQDALQQFIAQSHPTARHIQLILGADRLVLSGDIPVFGSRLPFVLIATAAPHGTKLNLDASELDLDGIAAKPAVRAALLAAFNPVLDLNKDLGLAGSTTMLAVNFINHKMVVQGRVHLPASDQ